MGKRELVVLFCVSSWCLVIAVWLFLEVPRVCLQFVIVVFPDHTQLLLLHARLRNNCSNQNNGLYINHLRERPFCSWWNVIEDTKHYLFTCNQYRNERLIFLKQLATSNNLTSNYYYSEMIH